MTKEYNKKTLEKLWNLLKEIEEKKQLSNDGSQIRLPCYPSGFSMDANETRKMILEMLSSLGAIAKLHKVKVKRGNEDYLLWAFLIGDNYQEVFDDSEGQYKAIANDFEETKHEQEVKKKSSGKVAKTKLISEIKKIIKTTHKFGKKEKKLLNILLDFKEHRIEKLLENEVSNSTNALSHLKKQVNDKLSDTKFSIVSLDGGYSDPTGSYQLNYLPDSE